MPYNNKVLKNSLLLCFYAMLLAEVVAYVCYDIEVVGGFYCTLSLPQLNNLLHRTIPHGRMDNPSNEGHQTRCKEKELRSNRRKPLKNKVM